MRQIDVQITKGQIESFHVTMEDNLPEVSATVALFTADNKKITTFSISTQKWCEPKFELPIEMIDPILAIAERLERIVIMECNRKLQRIEAPKESTAPSAQAIKEDEAAAADITPRDEEEELNNETPDIEGVF